jgi:hypothetical protein
MPTAPRLQNLPTPTDTALWSRSVVQMSTGQHKIRPIKIQDHEILGYSYLRRIPKRVFVEQWIGISTDEFHRAKDADVAYMKNRFPTGEADHGVNS